ncbi:MAG: PorT family protein [Clostridium sp.]|nr:PorT family protein [Bacteroides sp.]MCM1198151.1 PorT family protein [Clostridium sp.]
MDKLNDTDFDLEIKAILDGAEEEVPTHIWDSIEARLDEIEVSRKRRIIPLWLRNTGFVTAAAAAAALAIVLTGTFGSHLAGPADTDNIAVAEPSTVTAEDTMEEASHSSNPEEIRISTESGRTREISGDRFLAPDPEMKYVAEASETGEPAQENDICTSRPSEIPSSKSAINGSAKTEKYVDPFAFEEEARKSPKISITLSGNAIGTSASNSAAPVAKPMKANATRPAARKTINETGNSAYGVPISFGIGAKVALAPRWSIGAGIDYTLLTRSFKGTYIDGTGMPVEYAKIRNSQNYIGIPVNAYFSIISNRRIDFYAYAGGTAEKCIDNRYRMAPNVIYKEKVKGFQFSANAGIGVEFIFADMLGLYIDPSLRYYFKDKNQPKSIRTQNPLAFGCEIGLRVRL